MSSLRPVVPDGEMLGATIVPERHRMRAPVETAVELRLRHVLEQKRQQGIGGESASNAAYMLANSVSPPTSGTCSTRRILPMGGLVSHDTSECQTLPATKLT